MASTVDQIREQLSRQDGVTQEGLEPLASAYAHEVAQLNERLSKSASLLRKGLRSEAIQQANIRPNLFDWSARLDFPEIDDWFEILQFYQISLPARVNYEAVQQLQEAMVEEQPLEELLKQHRRLAIAKAPLAWRLKVLRAIANIDEMNPVWVEDVELWEKARLRELPIELNRAKADRDATACARIKTELTQSAWITPPPDALIKTATSEVRQLEFAAHCQQLEETARRLSDSFCEQDEAACRSYRAEWLRIAEELTLPIPEKLNLQVEPALLWLDERDEELEHADAQQVHVENLVAKLNESRSLLEIQKAYQIAISGGHELDTTLVNRYRSVTDELSLIAKRESVLQISGIVAATLLVATAFGLWQWRSAVEAEVDKSVSAMQQLLDEGKLREAQQYAESLLTTKPHLVQTTQMNALISDLAGRQRIEEERLQSFERYLSDADKEEDSEIDLGLLRQAEDLARSDGERERVLRVRRRKEKHDRAEQDAQFRALANELSEIPARLDSLESSELDLDLETSLAHVVTELNELQKRYSRAGAQGTDLIATLTHRASSLRDSVRKRLAQQKQEAEGLQRIRDARSLSEFHQSLETFVESMPQVSISQEFKNAAAEHELWAAVGEWNGFVENVSRFCKEMTAEGAKKQLEELGKLREHVENNPGFERCPSIEPLLVEIGKRKDSIEQLRSLLSKDWMSSLVTLEGQSFVRKDELQRVFAFANKIAPMRKKFSDAGDREIFAVDIIADSDGTVANFNFRGRITIMDQPKTTYDQLVLLLTAQAAEIERNWESQLLLAINNIMKADGLDSYMKETLIAKLLETALSGSVLLKERLGTPLLVLKQRLSQDSRWYDPQQANEQLEPKLLSLLQQEFGAAYKGIDDGYLGIRALASSNMPWVGSLQRGADGRIQAWLSQNAGSGELMVVERIPGESTKVRFEVVGTVANDSALIKSGSPALVAGRPLFLLPSVRD